MFSYYSTYPHTLYRVCSLTIAHTHTHTHTHTHIHTHIYTHLQLGASLLFFIYAASTGAVWYRFFFYEYFLWVNFFLWVKMFMSIYAASTSCRVHLWAFMPRPLEWHATERERWCVPVSVSVYVYVSVSVSVSVYVSVSVSEPPLSLCVSLCLSLCRRTLRYNGSAEFVLNYVCGCSVCCRRPLPYWPYGTSCARRCTCGSSFNTPSLRTLGCVCCIALSLSLNTAYTPKCS